MMREVQAASSLWLNIVCIAKKFFKKKSKSDVAWSPCSQDEGIYIRSGIVCVLRNAEIADGTNV